MKCEYCGEVQPEVMTNMRCVACGAKLPEDERPEFAFIGTIMGVQMFSRVNDKYQAELALSLLSNNSAYDGYPLAST